MSRRVSRPCLRTLPLSPDTTDQGTHAETEKNVADDAARKRCLDDVKKDVLENWLHKQVCAGKIPLVDAQAMISRDWYEAYLSIMKKPE